MAFFYPRKNLRDEWLHITNIFLILCVTRRYSAFRFNPFKPVD